MINRERMIDAQRQREEKKNNKCYSLDSGGRPKPTNQIFSSLNPLTSTLPVPLLRHSPVSSSPSSPRTFTPCDWLRRYLPPGMTIFPALDLDGAPSAARGLGNPSLFRSRRVKGFSFFGSGMGGGEGVTDDMGDRDECATDDNDVEDAEDAEEAGERKGVLRVSSSTSSSEAEPPDASEASPSSLSEEAGLTSTSMVCTSSA